MNAITEKLVLKSVPADAIRGIGACLRSGEGEDVPDWRYQDRLWIMKDGRPTLRKPVIAPFFEPEVKGAKGTFGEPVDLAEIEQDEERELLIDDIRRDCPDYLAKPEWCYLRWTAPGQVEAMQMCGEWAVIDYPMVVACDLKRQEDDGDRRKRKGSIKRIAVESGMKIVFRWRTVKAVFTRLDIELRKSPVVMSQHALDLVRK